MDIHSVTKKVSSLISTSPLLHDAVKRARQYHRQYKLSPIVVIFLILDLIIDGNGSEDLRSVRDSSHMSYLGDTLDGGGYEIPYWLTSPKENDDLVACLRVAFITDKLQSFLDYYSDPIVLMYITSKYAIENDIRDYLSIDTDKNIERLLCHIKNYYDEYTYFKIAEMLLIDAYYGLEFTDAINDQELSRSEIDKYSHDKQVYILSNILRDYHESDHDYTLIMKYDILYEIAKKFVDLGG